MRIALTILLAVSASVDPTVLARVDGHVIRRSADCKKAPDRSRCIAAEQARLEQLSKPLLIDAAARKYGVTVTQRDVAARSATVTDAQLRAAEERYKRLAEAALRVREGQDERVVFERDLRPNRITADQFEAILRMMPTQMSARQALAKDFVADSRRQLVDEARVRLEAEKLDRVIVDSAKHNGISRAEAEKRLWNELIMATHSVVFDSDFHLPDYKGAMADGPHS